MNYHCPVCRMDFNSDFEDYIHHVESEIVELIKRDHPEWSISDGTCPKCYKYYKKELRGES
ncbi:MAG: hypothetical protein AB1650_07415 [Candidatus Omnitrophota bacterium]